MAEPVNAEPKNIPRRRRKSPPRRTPAIIEQRERTPFMFGWGTHLDRRQREALKERIALLAGLVIAGVLVLLLGWGWYQDNVAGPASRNAVNNQTVAIVGSKTITYGYFKRVALFNKKELDSKLSQIQQEQSQLAGTKKPDQALSAQLSSEVTQLQQQLGTLPTEVEKNLIDDFTVLQRASSVGVTVSKKELNKNIVTQEEQAGGIHNLNKYLAKGGLARAEYLTLVKAGLLIGKLQTKLSKTTPHRQTQVDAAHILVSPKQKALAQRIFSKVKGGANFAALAKKYSKDTASAKKGGNLGYAAPSKYVPSFAKAVSSMKTGDVRLVQSQYGWHIIKLLGKKNVKLSGAEYQQAQQQAFTTWLQREEDNLHVQRIMDVTKIRGIAEQIGTANNPLSTIPQGGSIPGQNPAVPRGSIYQEKPPAGPAAPKNGGKSGKKSSSAKK